MLRYLCLALVVVGCIVMCATTVRYHLFLRRNRRAAYTGQKKGRAAEVLTQVVMLFCIFGYLVGIADVFLNDVEPIFLFVCVVFFVGGLFIAALVQTQINMAGTLQSKSMEIMRTFVDVIELKDPYTRGHSLHVYHLVAAFCRVLPARMRQQLSIPKLLDAALLHDIGKMGVPDAILNKPGPLDEGEWVAVRAHADNGARMLKGTGFEEISDWVRFHHERADGAGYHRTPAKMIPLESRILAVADTYSAMTTDREYHPSRTHEEALAVMCREAGAQLDADLVGYFCNIPREELDEARRRAEAGMTATGQHPAGKG